jgi:hypothetical protein
MLFQRRQNAGRYNTACSYNPDPQFMIIFGVMLQTRFIDLLESTASYAR